MLVCLLQPKLKQEEKTILESQALLRHLLPPPWDLSHETHAYLPGTVPFVRDLPLMSP